MGINNNHNIIVMGKSYSCSHNQNVLDPTREILMDLHRTDYYSSQYPTASGQNDWDSQVFTYEPWGSKRSPRARRAGIVSVLRHPDALPAKPAAIRTALQVLQSARMFAKNIIRKHRLRAQRQNARRASKRAPVAESPSLSPKHTYPGFHRRSVREEIPLPDIISDQDTDASSQISEMSSESVACLHCFHETSLDRVLEEAH